jgi:hypothetical protein
MAKLVATQSGYINLDHVKKLSFFEQAKQSFARIVWNDGTEESIEVIFDTSETTVSSETVPAPPGFRIVFADEISRPEGTPVHEEPIIAFRVPYSGGPPTPVTVSGEAGRSPVNKYAIVRPDGTVCDPYDRDYSGIAEFLAEMKKREEES